MAAGKPLPKRGRMTLETFVTLVAWPTLLAFLIIGVWHGAGWQFVLFGLLHGIYLIINHGWRTLRKRQGWNWNDDNVLVVVPSVLLTLACVVFGLAFFRSPDVGTALRLVEAMFGANGLEFQSSQLLTYRQVELTLVLLAIVWLLPNTQEWLRRFPTGLGELREPGWLERRLAPIGSSWQPSAAIGVAVGLLAFLAVAKAISAAPPEFIYFNF
jgi:hypothetical protein